MSTRHVSARWDGGQSAAIDISVSSDADPDLVNELIPRAERLCYVTNTLRKPPQITISQHPRA